MTDVEMTKLAAKAMSLAVSYDESLPLITAEGQFHPAVLDAQAMTLLKIFEVQVTWRHDLKKWLAIIWSQPYTGNWDTYSESVNRAIVECVAKMQASK